MSVALVPHTPPSPPATLDGTGGEITKQQKAAILLNVLLTVDAAPDLDGVATGSLKTMVDTMTSFGDVDRHTVDLVILEFLTELQEFGISLSADLDETIEALKGHVSDKALENIRKSYIQSPDADVWQRVGSVEPAELFACLQHEHLQVTATVLSKISSTLAAEVLGSMDATRAREVMLAIINAGDVKPEVIEVIGQGLCQSLFQTEGGSSFAKPPVERVGDIMNFAQSGLRDQLMEDFGKTDPEQADAIRKVMFTFPDIPARVQPRDVSAFTRAVDPETLLRAMKGAETEAPEAFDFILSSLATRAADALREEIAETEAGKKKDMEAAMTELIVAIRQLESDGAITLIIEEEDEEE